MSSSSDRSADRINLARQARWAVAALLTVVSTFLAAHEGHAPLPTRGAVADTKTGHLLLTADARQSIDVATEPVVPRVLDERVLAYASVVAPWRHHGFATAALAGRVVKVHVSPGQVVRAGDVLAEVKSLELDAFQQDLLTARSEVRLSEKLVAELKRSADAGAIAGQVLLNAETKHAQNRNALDVARARWLGLGLPEAQLDALLATGDPLPELALPVPAPVSGVVVHAELTVGKVVEPAEHLAEVIDLSVMWVKVGVLERDCHKVKIGQAVAVELVAYPGQTFRTQVKAISHALDPVTNVFTVWAELTNPAPAEPRFQPGMAGRAHILVQGELRPTVPTAAIVREGGERFVLVEEAGGERASEYRRVPVVPGREDGGSVEVLAGAVYTGDRVVTRGAALLGPFFAPTVLNPSREAARAMRLKVEPAAVGPVDEAVTLDGTVDVPPAGRGSASSQLAGTVRSVRTDRGQKVRAGDVLAEVFSPELLTLQQELLRTELEAALTAQTWQNLKAAPGVAAQRLWEHESLLTTFRARAGTVRRQLAAAGLTTEQVERLVARREMIATVPVRAPLSGTVVGFDKTLGQAVAAHEALFEVHDLEQRPLVRGSLSEYEVGRVRIGQPVRVRFVADPDVALAGTVVRSGRTFATDGRTISVWVELATRPPAPLLHNQLASLAVVTGAHPPALRVPRAAVISDGASFVFVQRPDGGFERRTVSTGPSDDRFVTISHGLSAGEPVAVAGAAELMTAFASLR